MKMPNLFIFIINTVKSGTTSFYHYLKQHPQIYMSLVAVLLIRLFFTAFFYPEDQVLALNFDRWGTIAANVAEGYGYAYPYHANPEGLPPMPNAQRVPVPVLWFAGIFALFGRQLWPIMIGNWLLDVGTAIILLSLARYIFPEKQGVAILAVLMFAFYLPEILNTYQTCSEPISMLLLMLHLLTLVRLLDQPSLGRAATAGLCLGLVALSNPIVLAFPAVVFGLVLLQSRRLWHVAKNFGILVLMFAVVLSPWVVRNFLTFRDFVPGSTLLGINLFMNSYYLDSPNYLEWLTPLTTIEAKMEQILNNRGDSLTNYDELGRDRLYTQEALRRIALRPDRYFLLSAHRFLRLWFNLGYGEAPSVRSWLVAGMNVTLFALAVVGSILEPRVRARWAILIWATILYFTIVHTLVQAYLRHIFPVIPLVILLAARSIYGGLRQVLEVIAHLTNRSRSTHSHLKAQR